MSKKQFLRLKSLKNQLLGLKSQKNNKQGVFVGYTGKKYEVTKAKTVIC